MGTYTMGLMAGLDSGPFSTARAPLWAALAFLVVVSDRVHALEVGDGAPFFRLPELTSGTTLAAPDLLRARPWTLLVVWNTECPECVSDFVSLSRSLSAPGWDDLSLVTLCTDDERAPEARRLVAAARVPGTTLWDPDRQVAGLYGARDESFGAFLIDEDARIRLVQIDHPDSVDRFAEKLRQVMDEGARARPRPPAAVADGPEPGPEEPVAPSSEPWSSPDRIHVRGDADVRWFQVDVDGRSPTGLFGEVLETQTTLLRRARIEIIGRLSPRVSAGGLVRLTNEPDEVLELGPEYYARGEGSAFVIVRSRPATIRLGYYAVHLTPLSLQRWDRADLGLGGNQRGCAVCGGATAGMVLESLEEVGSDITMEGARVDGAIAGDLGWTALYARPRERRLEEIPGLGTDATSFRRQQDLYAAQITWSRHVYADLPPMSVGFIGLHVRDDLTGPVCPSPWNDPLCAGDRYAAARTTAFGPHVRHPLGRRVLLEGEWLRVASTADTRGDSLPTVWANGFRVTAEAVLVPEHLRIESAWLRLEDRFVSPYGALTYAGNREGARFRARGETGPFAFDLFARRVKPIEDEEIEGDIPGATAELKWETILSGGVSVALRKGWQAGWGYQRELTDVSGAGAGDGTRDSAQIDASGEVDGLVLRIVHQWIDEDAVRRDLTTARATITSVSASARF